MNTITRLPTPVLPHSMLHLAIYNKAPLEKIVSLAATEGLLVRNKHGNTPLHHAIIHHPELKVLEALVSPASLVAVNNYGNTPLHTAVFRERSLDVVKIVFHPDADVGNKKRETPLHNAEGNVAAYLVKNGFDRNVADRDGNYPLHKACNKLTAGILLTTEAANAKNKAGLFPINTTCDCNIISLLVDFSCDEAKNTKGKCLKTPLDHMIYERSLEEVKKFITEKNTGEDSFAMPVVLTLKRPIEFVKLFYRKEIHYGDDKMIDIAIGNGNSLEVLLYFLKDESQLEKRHLGYSITSDCPEDVIALIASRHTCHPDLFTFAVLERKISKETIAKLYPGKPVVIVEHKKALDIVRKAPDVAHFFSFPKTIVTGEEKALLGSGYTRVEISGLFTKAPFVENNECFCCLMEFEAVEAPLGNAPEATTTLLCDHRIHTSCYKLVKSEKLRCFCGVYTSLKLKK